MNLFQQKAIVIKNELMGPNIYRLTFSAYDIAKIARAGQFIMVQVANLNDPLLNRPFSIHQVTAKGNLQILFKVVGAGTKTLAGLLPGDVLNVVGPLGNGFSLPEESSICLVGGGMGIAPLLFLAKTILKRNEAIELKILLGAQQKEDLTNILINFEDLGVDIKHATDDGSSGHHGFVTELIKQEIEISIGNNWNIYCCGPTPMMKQVAKICALNKWNCQVAMETMMACGIGACLGCTIQKSNNSQNQSLNYLHVCKDGPVFNAEEIQWP